LHPLKGIAFKIAATFMFVLMAACVKAVAARYPIGEVMFFRSSFALVPLLLLVSMQGSLLTLWRTRRPFGHMMRVCVGASGMFFNFWGLALVSLPEATAIGYATPVFAVIFAVLILRETVRIYRWMAVFVGFIGVFIIVLPHIIAAKAGASLADTSLAGVLVCLTGAIVSALAMTTVRHLTATENTSTIVLYFSVGCSLISLLSLPFGWKMPGGMDLVLLVASGLLGGIAQLFLTQGYRLADSSLIAPFEYTSMLFAAGLGYVLFGELPTQAVLTGSCLVIGAGVFVIWREHQLGLERRREIEATKN
jgi:drug/metabolite transporter (DMT)-like permease